MFYEPTRHNTSRILPLSPLKDDFWFRKFSMVGEFLQNRRRFHSNLPIWWEFNTDSTGTLAPTYLKGFFCNRFEGKFSHVSLGMDIGELSKTVTSMTGTCFSIRNPPFMYCTIDRSYFMHQVENHCWTPLLFGQV
jgi:hypothetical protein